MLRVLLGIGFLFAALFAGRLILFFVRRAPRRGRERA